MTELRTPRPSNQRAERELGLAARLVAAARAHPADVALVDGPQRTTYGEFLGRAAALAADLRAAGAGPGDLVGVVLPRSADLVVAVAGVTLSGAAYVPVDESQPAERRAAILADAAPRVIVAAAGSRDGVPGGVRIVPLPAGTADLPTPPAFAAPDDPAYVIYTSGSTGRPKGVVVTQHNVDRLFTTTEPLFGFGRDDVWTLFHSIAFDFSVWEMWGALLHGGRLVVVPAEIARAADAFHAMVLREGVTVLSQTPSAFRAFDAADAAAERPSSALRHVVFGGEALDPRSLAGWFGAHGDDAPRLVNMYGITETTVHTTYRRMRSADARSSGASLIGAALPDLTIDLFGADGRPVADGEIGEIHVGGEGVARGYLRRDELTAERFVADPRGGGLGARLYRSGDLARRTADGDLEYLGRGDAQVKLRGYRIELGEIEAALRDAAGVREAVAALREDGAAGPRLVAYVLPVDGFAVDPHALRTHVASRLPEYMVPAAYVRIERVPRTVNDKVDRASLPEPAAGDLARAASGGAPRTDTERAIADIWRDVLGVPEAGRDEDFFALGGHSLLAIRVGLLCAERLGKSVSGSDVIESRTLASLAARADAAPAAAARTEPPAAPAASPLTPGQVSVHLQQQLAGADPILNEAVAFELCGPLDPRRLVAELAVTLSGHPAFASRFVERDGRWMHEPGERTAVRVEFADAPDATAEELRARLVEFAAREFDLARGPLARGLVVRIAADRCVLAIVAHHLVVDEWSYGVILDQLAARLAGLTPAGPRDPGPFAHATRRAQEGLAAAAADREFWRGELEGASLEIDLPAPAGPPAAPNAGGIAQAALDVRETARVRDALRRSGVTEFEAGLAAFAAVLEHEAHRPDVVVLTTLADRDRPDAAGVAGYLLDVLPVRLRLDGEPRVLDVLAGTRSAVARAGAHRALPLGETVASAGLSLAAPSRGAGAVLYTRQEDLSPRLTVPDVSVAPVRIDLGVAKFDLSLFLESGADRLGVRVEHRFRSVDRATAQRIASRVARILAAVAASPQARLSEIEMLDAEERRAALAASRAPAGPPRPWPRVPEAVAAAVERSPDAPAVVEDGHTVSYRALLAAADELAARLESLGVGVGHVVPVVGGRTAATVASWLGVMRAGAAYAPIDAEQPPQRRAAMIAETGAHVVVADARARDGVPAETAAIDPADTSVPARAGRGTGPVGDLAYVIFTSGSTGRPKGVEVGHDALAHFVAWQRRRFALGPADRTTLVSGLGFDVAAGETWPTLAAGAALHLPSEETRLVPEALRDWIAAQRLTVAFAPTVLGESLIRLPWPAGTALRAMHVAGEALRRRPARQLPFEVVNLYGPTEYTVYATHAVVSPDGDGLPPIGVPLDDTSAYVVDHLGRLCGDDELGELWLAGPQIAVGYRGRPDATGESFRQVEVEPSRPERVYRTGDLVRRRAGGALHFVGRRDGQMKLRGVRIETGEVESALLSHPAVASCAVSLRGEPGDAHLAAYVEAAAGADPPDAASLASHLAARLPRAMVPTRWAVVGALPRTPSGKIDRRALASLPHEAASVAAAPITDELERAVAEIFTETLGVPATSRDADFLRLGGHSLQVARFVVRCRERLGAAPSLAEVFENPTVAGVAAAVRAARATARDAVGVRRVARDGPVPLSPQQRALWLDVTLRPDSDVYNETIAARVPASIDPDRLRRAAVRVAATHELLRARFVEVNGDPAMLFDVDPANVDFDFAEVSDAAAAEAGLSKAASRPFDLVNGPVWRMVLRRTSSGESSMALVAHHLIVDAAAQAILVRGIAAAYRDPDAPPQPGAFDVADLAAYEHACLEKERTALERYWAAALAGADFSPSLPPPCIPCPPGEEAHGGAARRRLGPATARRVRELSAAWGTTPFNVYAAAFLALLRVYTGRDDQVVGLPVSLRDTAAAQDVVGYLLNPLALRVRLRGDASFRANVVEVAAAWQAARAHARLPLDLVLQAANARRAAGPEAPIQVFFSLREPVELGFARSGAAATAIRLPAVHAKFRMFLLVEESAADSSLLLEYRRSAFDPEMAARFLAHLDALLASASDDPDAPLDTVRVLGEAEQERLIAWGTDVRPYPRDRRVDDLFADMVRGHPDAVALVEGGARISYGSLDGRANSVAAALRAAGVRRGDRVALVLPRGVRFVACALGALKAGAAYVPLDPSHPAARLRRLLGDVGARVGVRDADAIALVGVERWIVSSVADAETDECPPVSGATASDAAYVMFTSGSTGVPKGIAVPHRAVVRLVRGQRFARMGPEETWLHLAPTAFDASTLEIWAPLLNAGRCVIVPGGPLSGEEFAETVRRERATSAWLTASHFNSIVDEAPEHLAGLSQILTGGEVVSPAHLRRAMEAVPGARFVNGYGPTENTTFTCCHVVRPEDVAGAASVPIGRPVANTCVAVVGRGGRIVPVGVPGELVASGDGLALGYVGGAAAANGAFVEDAAGRRYRTGDRVRWRPDGLLEFLGRFDEQVKLRGNRIEPREIASCLEEHPGVARAAVVVENAGESTARLVAYVVARNPAAGPSPAALADHVAQRLPRPMVPSAVVVIGSLPLTANGKLDVGALPRPDPAPIEPTSSGPPTEMERVVASIWRDLLRRPSLGPDDDFFASGGNSLLAVRMLAALDHKTGVRLPARVLFGAPTVRRLSAYVTASVAARPPDLPSVVRVREGSRGAPLFCLPGVGGHAFQYRELAERMRTPRPVLALQVHDLDVPDAVFESVAETADVLVQRMRSVRPHGPYALTGYSYGGIVALEIARRLTALGESVEFLGLIDTYAPGVAVPTPRLRRIGRHLANLAAAKNLAELSDYLGRRVKRRAGRVAFAVRELLGLRVDATADLERRVDDIALRCIRAYHAYRATPYAGRLSILRAARLGDFQEAHDPTQTCGWGPLCDSVEVVDIDCEHLQLFKEPHMTQLARWLDDALPRIGDGS